GLPIVKVGHHIRRKLQSRLLLQLSVWTLPPSQTFWRPLLSGRELNWKSKKAFFSDAQVLLSQCLRR
ncbi:hypothetical protein LINPERPRIM_LOCUS5786, partial [Linum perenne]